MGSARLKVIFKVVEAAVALDNDINEKSVLLIKLVSPVGLILTILSMLVVPFAPNPEGPNQLSTFGYIILYIVLVGVSVFFYWACRKYLGWFKFLDKED